MIFSKIYFVRFRLHPSLDLGVVAKKCPFNYTGADFYALCSDAMLKAMSRTAEAIETKVGTYYVMSEIFCPI
jgi:peroxin-6